MMNFKDATDETRDASAPPVDESQKSLSLLGGVGRPEGMEAADGFDADGDGPAGRFSALNRGTMLLLVIIALAVGTLYLMRLGSDKLSGSGLTADVEARVEAALVKLASPVPVEGDPQQKISQLLDDTAPLIMVFQQDASRQQVPIEFIKKNPFFIERSAKAPPVARADNSEAEAMRQRERRLVELQREFASMRLTSVVLGARPLAIIDNELYQPGATIGSFTVKAIDQLAVVLTADGNQYLLKLDHDAKPAPGRRR